MIRVLSIFILFFLFFHSAECHSFSDSSIAIHRKKGVWFTPSYTDIIDGLAIGPLESHILHTHQQVRGVSLVLVGMGWSALIKRRYDPLKRYYNHRLTIEEKHKLVNEKDSLIRTQHFFYINKGLLISGTGAITDQIKGVNVALFVSKIRECKGLSINIVANLIETMTGVSIGLYNESFSLKGVQIGIVNRTIKQKGLQIGFWNTNLKRSFPIINW